MILNYYNDLLFTPSELFLNKDFGQVATVLGRLHNKSVKHLICCNKPNNNFRIFEGNEVVQIKKIFNFLPKKLDFIKNLFAYWFIVRNYKKFKVLVLFPFSPSSDFLLAKFFLAFNHDAKIIMKLDANLDNLNQLKNSYRLFPNSRIRQHYYYRRLLEMSSLIMYETSKVGYLLHDKNFLNLSLCSKSINIFNGLSRVQLNKIDVNPVAPKMRENIIIFSGRLWAPEKNVELIFRADPVPVGWVLKFIGSIDDSFQEIIDKYRSIDPHFDKKYIFLGEISDRKLYFEELSKGKVLLLCSNKEGFPMVYAEAHYFHLFIVQQM